MERSTVPSENVWNYETGEPRSKSTWKSGDSWPKRYYVYVWLDDGAVFYVGKGRRNRGIARHTGKGVDGPVSTRAEVRRHTCGNFRCVVVKSNLSEKNAKELLEELLHTLQPWGNNPHASRRSEEPSVARERLEALRQSQDSMEYRRDWVKRLTAATNRKNYHAKQARTLREIVRERGWHEV